MLIYLNFFRYSDNTDKTMAQIKFVSTTDSSLLGAISWFAVHPTSMNNTNLLISSDNVGYASILLEQTMNPKGTLIGKVIVFVFDLSYFLLRSAKVFDISGTICFSVCIDELRGRFSEYNGP